MLTEEDRCTLIRNASYISIIGNLFISLGKIIVGIIFSSLSVIADGVDSGTDVVISLVTLIVTYIMSKPSDKKHPWGYHRAETVASVFVAVIILFAGLQVLYTAMGNILRPIQFNITTNIFTVCITFISITVKLLLAVNQYMLGKKAGSHMLIANAKNMISDILISTSVLLGLGFSFLLHQPLIDPIIAIFISIYILKTGVEIILELSVELMDGNASNKLYNDLFNAVLEIPNVHNPHKARIRKMSNMLDIDIDIELDGSLSIAQAHLISEQISNNVKSKIPNVYDVMIHIEPLNEGEHNEAFGISQKDVTEK